jgi:SAM-dependent methyltransferase
LEKIEYQKHFELEEKFWWFRGRRKILMSILHSRLKAQKNRSVLDAGCGTGFNLNMYESLGTVFGCDFSEEALYFCRKRGLSRLTQADLRALPFKSGTFDIVSVLDVLSHESIRDDIEVLKDIAGLLKEGGLILLADNALEMLRSPHDRAYHVRERYRRKTLRRRMEAAGFRILRMSYFNFFLFPVIFLIRLAERTGRAKAESVQSDLKAAPRLLNAVLCGILGFEALLSKRIDLPWGSSIIGLAVKSSGGKAGLPIS